MSGKNASQVADLLREYGRRASLRGGNPYRAKAYLRAAESIGTIAIPLGQVIAEGRLREISGVGEAIADIITKLHKTGSHPALDKMRGEIPAGVLEMLEIPGLRPEKVVKIYKDLGIASLDDLERATREGRLDKVKGLGRALSSKLLRGLELRKTNKGRLHLHRAAELIASLKTNVKRSHQDVVEVSEAGDFRRRCELVSDLSVVARFRGRHEPEVTALANGAKLYLTDKARYGATLLHATGSEAHLEELNGFAAAKGLSLRPDGLWRGRKRVAAESEAAIYEALELAWIPPELREGRDEIKRAKSDRLPKLVEETDLKGILHAHTDRSDGVHSLEEMAEGARDRGYTYFGVADHSQSAHYAGGLSAQEIEDQHREADALNKRYRGRFQVFKGIESDILADGALDYPDEILARFDFVVASVHSRFGLDQRSQTERIVRAVAHPRTTILGHMTGRQLLRRPGYEIDIERILRACAKRGVAVEVNANPWRLDLDWRWHQRALDAGCMLSINPDAHSTDELDLTKWGVAMARKGGVPKERVLNCMTLSELRTYFTKRHRRCR
jgi:DNA polymerase (family X)